MISIRSIKRKVLDALPARWHVMFDFARAHRRLPNLANPRTFNEKIAWRKLYERDERLPDLVDKIKAKEIIAGKFGDGLVIPTLAVYDNAADLDFSAPPLSQPPYVIKANHGSGLNVFIKDRSFDPEEVRQKLAGYLRFDHAAFMEEWAYSKVERKILVEPFIETPKGYLPDYKFHVFAGMVYAIEVMTDRFKKLRVSMFYRDWKPMEIRKWGYLLYEGDVAAPSRLADMIKLSESIGKDFSYVRVDLYQIGNEIKFGELTFYPAGGCDQFDPPEWDDKFGQQWKLDTIR
jgi:hypothetical protein